MDDKTFKKRLREEIRRRAGLSWEDWSKPLVERGIIDHDGTVLVCMPPPPRTVFDEDGNATVIYPDLSQPPPPPIRRAKPKARADAKTKFKKPRPGDGAA